MKLNKENFNIAYDSFLKGRGAVASVEAAILKYLELESPRTEPAQVTWRRIGEQGVQIGEVYTNGISVEEGFRLGDKYYLTLEDLLSLPFPAEPTPEELAEREFEAWAKDGAWESDKAKELAKTGWMGKAGFVCVCGDWTSNENSPL